MASPGLSKRPVHMAELVKASIKQGVPTDISAQVSTAEPILGAPDSCSALQQHASQADGCVQLEAKHQLVVLLCMQSGNTSGTVLIYNVFTTMKTAGTPQAPGNIYRVRIMGPEIMQPAVNYCGNVAAASLSVSYPGVHNRVVARAQTR